MNQSELKVVYKHLAEMFTELYSMNGEVVEEAKPVKQEQKIPYIPPIPVVDVPPTALPSSVKPCCVATSQAAPVAQQPVVPQAAAPQSVEEPQAEVVSGEENPQVAKLLQGMQKECDTGIPVHQWVQKQKRSELLKAAEAIGIPNFESAKVSEIRAAILAVLGGSAPEEAATTYFVTASEPVAPQNVVQMPGLPGMPSAQVPPMAVPGLPSMSAPAIPSMPMPGKPATPIVPSMPQVGATPAQPSSIPGVPRGFGAKKTEQVAETKVTAELLEHWVSEALATVKGKGVQQLLGVITTVAQKVPLAIRRNSVYQFVNSCAEEIRQYRENGDTAVADQTEKDMSDYFASRGCNGNCQMCSSELNAQCIAILNCNTDDPIAQFKKGILDNA